MTMHTTTTTIRHHSGDGWDRVEHHHHGANETFVTVVGEPPIPPARQAALSVPTTLPKRPLCEVDTECDHDYWLCKFYAPDGQMYDFDMHTGGGPLNIAALQWFIDNFTLVTFNGKNYDEPMIALAMTGATPRQLKEANDAIIVGGLKSWQFYRHYNIEPPRNIDHIDIMEVAPGVRIGLKTYMGRMHAPTIQDLPFDPHHPMPVEMRPVTAKYCGNDLVGTRMLKDTVSERLSLRVVMSEKYGVDMRSRSDAQMAEDIIKSQLGFKPERRIVPHGYQFQYQPPPFIKFSTPEMQAAFATVCNAWFPVYDVDQLGEDAEELVGADGKKIKTGVKIPPELKALVITVGSSQFQFGIGGLHSKEKARHHHTILGKWSISDHDVVSYYPSLILSVGMYPQQLGPIFLEIYGRVYVERLQAKAESQAEEYKLKSGAGDHAVYLYWKTIADGLKIVLNGTFGKLFSKHSIMFAPELGIQVTITGQLSLCMLIEMLYRCGIEVLSANTDGIVLRTPVGREWLRDDCIKYWEKETGLKTEATFYRDIYSQSVNSYIAVKMDGAVKGKGSFAGSGVINNVHPEKDICSEAVIAWLTKGVPLVTTIRACTDIRKFLTIRSVKGGGIYYPKSLGVDEKVINAEGAVYLGKTVRWYYSTDASAAIHYKPKPPDPTAKKQPNPLGNLVASSTGARPCMSLPSRFPDDVNYGHYVTEAIKLLQTLGVDYG